MTEVLTTYTIEMDKNSLDTVFVVYSYVTKQVPSLDRLMKNKDGNSTPVWRTFKNEVARSQHLPLAKAIKEKMEKEFPHGT